MLCWVSFSDSSSLHFICLSVFFSFSNLLWCVMYCLLFPYSPFLLFLESSHPFSLSNCVTVILTLESETCHPFSPCVLMILKDEVEGEEESTKDYEGRGRKVLYFCSKNIHREKKEENWVEEKAHRKVSRQSISYADAFHENMSGRDEKRHEKRWEEMRKTIAFVTHFPSRVHKTFRLTLMVSHFLSICVKHTKTSAEAATGNRLHGSLNLWT